MYRTGNSEISLENYRKSWRQAQGHPEEEEHV
jgi:hypothetical protein